MLGDYVTGNQGEKKKCIMKDNNKTLWAQAAQSTKARVPRGSSFCLFGHDEIKWRPRIVHESEKRNEVSMNFFRNDNAEEEGDFEKLNTQELNGQWDKLALEVKARMNKGKEKSFEQVEYGAEGLSGLVGESREITERGATKRNGGYTKCTQYRHKDIESVCLFLP
ncbi:unnamed protein product [Cuscuta campestris]|uniref:Uncharacterized protein n=1 Tax=Cuscuta campestris TaxID=132261 RepID=A0A484KL12_9ASTE|nr:unnamed protein product [Cuscuta campestris]